MSFSSALLKSCAPLSARGLHTTPALAQIQKMTRLRCVDNSTIGKQAMLEGKPPKVIQVYSKRKYGLPGDKVLCTVKGHMIKGILVGCHQDQLPFRPKFDSNNVVLISNDGSPLGTRILAPIPTHVRRRLKDLSRPKGADYTKLLSICTKYV